MFDVSSRESFQELDNWLSEAAKYGADPRQLPITLCANKIDKKRVVSEEEGKSYAVSRGLQYSETSASSGDNVQDMFNSLFQTAFRRMMTS